MGPGLIGQLNQSMQQGVPEPGQVSGTSPEFQPGLQPPIQPPMPNKSPASEIHKTPLHRAFERRGMAIPPQLVSQGQPMPSQPIQGQPQEGEPTTQIPLSEAELIIKALTTRLGHHSKLEQKVAEALLPQGNMGQNM